MNRTPRRLRFCRSPSRATKKPSSPSEEEREPARVIGALIVEQMVDSRTPDGFLQRVDVVRTHSATALTNALEYEGLFLMPVWRALGKGTRCSAAARCPRRSPFSVRSQRHWPSCASTRPISSSKATAGCEPTIRQSVWAEINGYVKEVKIRARSIPSPRANYWSSSRSLRIRKADWRRTQGELESTRQDLISTRAFA